MERTAHLKLGIVQSIAGVSLGKNGAVVMFWCQDMGVFLFNKLIGGAAGIEPATINF
ncbi:hypothetical protein [Legionella jordanis]|uniref:hypothetical protein n=1 Tax=Legionella jordanis TaxID=456 RepID=UPI000A859637|nr:hypothetical protein [Legionella jordanis]